MKELLQQLWGPELGLDLAVEDAQLVFHRTDCEHCTSGWHTFQQVWKGSLHQTEQEHVTQRIPETDFDDTKRLYSLDDHDTPESRLTGKSTRAEKHGGRGRSRRMGQTFKYRP